MFVSEYFFNRINCAVDEALKSMFEINSFGSTPLVAWLASDDPSE